MKHKIIFVLFLLSLLSCIGLGGLIYFIQTENKDLQQEHTNTLSNQGDLTQNITDLENELLEKDSFIQGQKDYISELSSQLEDFVAEPEDEDTPSNKKDSKKEGSYTKKFPDLYAKEQTNSGGNKKVYLTFDDGPSALTPKVLDILDEYDAKATFFVVYTDNKEYEKYLKEVVERGHQLAIHSYTHDYKKIYASVDAYLDDFSKIFEWVYDITGERCNLFRFPGGSSNGYNRKIIKELVVEMERRGFIYYDWNVSSGDGSNLTMRENVIENITTNVESFDFPVVLMHDANGKQETLAALPTVMNDLKKKGYTFTSLNAQLKPIQYDH